MDFERQQFETAGQEREEQTVEQGIAHLEAYIGNMRKEIAGVLPMLPLTKDGRIDPEGYKDVFSQEPGRPHARTLENLREQNLNAIVQELKNQKTPKEQIAGRIQMERQKYQVSELLEQLITALLYKRFFNEAYVVVRASAFDDAHHKADVLMIDWNTGEIICAFDVTMTRESGQRQKQDILHDVNERGGTKLKYGLATPEESTENNSTPVKASVSGVPVFMLSMPTKGEEGIEQTLAYFQNSNELTEEERRAASRLVLNQAYYSARSIALSDLYPDRVRAKAQKFVDAVDKTYTGGKE